MSFPLETIVSRCKRKGFVYPGSDIYGGLANSWDFWPYGSLLKKNIADARWTFFVQHRDDMVWMDTAILAHPRTWEASGHVGGFSDALVDDKISGKRFRADKLIEASLEAKKERFWEEWVLQYVKDTFGVENLSPEARGPIIMKDYLVKEKVKNPDTKKDADWTDIREFNLMLHSFLGPLADESSKVYLRPETCQSLFVDFKAICDSTRMRIPFGMAQIGKAFRNEITPWQFLYRTREFEQMEIEYMVEADPKKAEVYFDEWKQVSMQYRTEILWVSPEHLQFKKHDKLAHYAADAYDIEYKFPRWWGEIAWIHNRTDFDLRQHQEFSHKDMQYHDPKTGQRYTPRCIEASTGLGRSMMVTMLEFYDEEILTKPDGSSDTRVVVRFPFAIAPIKCAILPLMEKDEEMIKIGETIFHSLKKEMQCEFDTWWNIGKRYRRQDEIGTPFCITIDHQSKEDWTVTLRYRDTMEQKRVKIDDLSSLLLS